MAQFRKDPFGSAWVIISPERGLEASDFGSASIAHGNEPCPLCPGLERTTGAEIMALGPGVVSTDGAEWRMRVIVNPQAILHPGAFSIAGDELFRQATGSGVQELIVEHREHRQLDSMSLEHLVDLLKLYRERLNLLTRWPGVEHVQLTRNVGRVAGAAFDHPHAQLLALPVGSRWVDEERTAAAAYYDRQGRCLFCAVIEAELAERERIISHNERFVALAPYAAKTPFETWLLPRQHASNLNTLTSDTLPYLADLLRGVLRAINAALNTPPYNMMLHLIPSEEAGYHWHIEILPRLTTQAGFDWGSGFYINPTPPEDAARFLREALAMQEVSR